MRETASYSNKGLETYCFFQIYFSVKKSQKFTEIFPIFSISWRAFSVALVSDPDSQVGQKEVLTPIQINDTIPSWNQGVLDVPSLIFNYGLHKFVFRFQVMLFLFWAMVYMSMDVQIYNFLKQYILGPYRY